MQNSSILSLALFALSGISSAQSNQVGSWTLDVPRPSGPRQVGTLSLVLGNAVAHQAYSPNSKRELPVRFWYPATNGKICQTANYATPPVWAYLSRISGLPLPTVRTNSCQDALPEPGAHPVVIFSHGYTGTFTDATFIFEDLASRGFIVASVAHSSDTAAVEFPDGRLITSKLGSYLAAGTLRLNWWTLQQVRAIRLEDVSFVLDRLQALNGTKDSPFLGRLDLSRVGIIGHSLGGEIAVTSLKRDPRIRAAVSLNGVFSPVADATTEKPLLLLTTGAEGWDANACQLWEALHGERLGVHFPAGDHYTLTDGIWLVGSLPRVAAQLDTAERNRLIVAIRDSLAAFLGRSLSEHSSVSSWSVVRYANYSDAVVTTRTESLCQSKVASATGERK